MTTPTSPDPGRETRLIDIKGRLVTVRKLTDAQMMLMLREAKVLQSDEAGLERKLTALSRVFDILESAVVQAEDKEYLVNLNVAGDIEISDLMVFITAFGELEVVEKPKVRRGRPPLKRAAA
jgi:hypothetical protein